MEFTLKKKGNAAYPSNEFAQESFDKIPDGTLFKGEFVKGRNYMNLQRYMVFIGVLWRNMDFEMQKRFGVSRKFRKALEWISGNREIIPRKNGPDIEIVGSVSYESIKSEDEFKQKFSALIDAALEYFPTWTKEDIQKIVENEIINFM